MVYFQVCSEFASQILNVEPFCVFANQSVTLADRSLQTMNVIATTKPY